MIIWILIPEVFLCLPPDYLCKLTCHHLLFAQQPVEAITQTFKNPPQPHHHLSVSPSSIQLLEFIFILVFWLHSCHTRLVFEICNLDGGGAFSVTAMKCCKLHRLHVSDEAITVTFLWEKVQLFPLTPLYLLCMLHAELCSGVQRNFSEEPFALLLWALVRRT